MKYNAQTDELLISCKEFVTNARRGICTTLPVDEDEPILSTGGGEVLTYSFDIDEHRFTLTAHVKCASKGEVSIYVPTDSSPKRPKKEVIAQARGEGYIAAFIIAEEHGCEQVTISYTYFNRMTAEENTVRETVKRKKLSTFFEKCKMSTKVYARPEIERVTERLPSMKKIKFPYKNVRDGQSEIMHSVYKNVARGGRLFTAAPTGTGKTVSMLYPAVRALGNEKCDKIFYLTPKTTTANAARDCILKLTEGGAKIRAVIIPSKERACKCRLVCRRSRLLCNNARCNKLADAVLDLYDTGTTVTDLNELWQCAQKYSVCPHELALSYAELCDIVICDVNYLFDPAVYIRRFFTDGGNYAFLIDEAHNLPDRAREMYSAEISEEALVSLALSDFFPEGSGIKEVTRGAADAFYNALIPAVKEDMVRDDDGKLVGAAHLSEIPYALYDIFDALIARIEDEIFKSFSAKDEEAAERTHALREYYYRIKKFRDAMESFDSSYEFFIFAEDDRLRARCFCIDPSKMISKRLDKGTSATFFSGTLSPMYYYRAVLGGYRGSDMLEVDSPFDPSQLSVSIMDKISTRLSERDDTLGAVCRVIAATVSARRGNYMIFSPSFAYSEALARMFRAKYPKIRVLEQKKGMSVKERAEFLAEFEKESPSYLIGFCVMGGIYSEGVDLAGESLIGAVVVGIGIPSLSYEREAIAAYYNEKYEEGKQFAYIYPGMNRVLQAAGRVIRRDDDKGVIVLIDDRFDDPIYKTVIPKLWSDMKFIKDPKELRAVLDEFWRESDGQSSTAKE